MEFRLLGPVEVASGDAPWAVPGGKPRALLAALLLEPGRVISVDRLIDLLWEDSPPETARALVQTHVAALRRVGEGRLGQVVRTRQPGYLADVAPAELDWRGLRGPGGGGRGPPRPGGRAPAGPGPRAAAGPRGGAGGPRG